MERERKRKATKEKGEDVNNTHKNYIIQIDTTTTYYYWMLRLT